MNESNFVRRVSYLTPGDGYRKCYAFGLLGNVRAADGTGLTGASVPAIAALETNFYGLQVAQAQTFCGKFTWVAPDDYDNDADELRVRLLCNMSGNTAADKTVTISPTVYRKRPNPGLTFVQGGTTYTGTGTGVALSLDLGVTASTIYVPQLTTSATDFLASTANANTTWYEMNCDFNLPSPTAAQIAAGTKNRSLAATADASIKAGDSLQFTLTASTRTTDAINIYGLEIWYRSNLAFTDINSR